MAAKKKASARKKSTAKKAATKKAATRKAASKKAAKKAPARKVTAVKDPMTKTEIYSHIAEQTGLSKKDVSAVFDEFSTVIERHIKRNAAGEFKLPGMFKVRVVRKPATRARKGINPFTGEETVFKAKPARNVVKVQPLKKLKDMVS